ncbi:YeeE/YedE family protein [Nocardioides bruguierae]|uniref:YeeE/YedE family protein n=1 Tax=Nocardioides bruguierae TaxID=2945102 RepID=UPI0020214573|nr:YeeE/YedE family protein [Nocardioides bruguierae]MCL8026234.1 YeeE/YedE family protein [Nocardioides bruguierae]
MSLAAQAPSRPAARPTPRAPEAGRPQWGVLTVGVVALLALVVAAWTTQGWPQAALLALGAGLGFALFHARFGFTSAWRQLVSVGQGRGLRAHSLLLALTTVLFAPVLAMGLAPVAGSVSGNVAPVGVSLVVGAFVFAVGMQIGGACASGTLYAVGSGQTSILLTLGGFVVGATVGAAHLGWWARTPNIGAVSLADVFGSYAAGVVVTLVVLALIVTVTIVVERRRTPPPIGPVPTARGLARVLRGSWPLWVGAAALAVLNLGVLLVSGSPWGVTTAFALWGSKAAGALGIADPSTWTFWSGDRADVLAGSVLAESTSLTDLGIIVGAMVASALAGAFTLHQRVPGRLALGAVVGGLLMGYGARLAYGCNIGAYLGGISSLSLHGWVWGAVALVGTVLGVRLRPLFGLSRPQSSDSVC